MDRTMVKQQDLEKTANTDDMTPISLELRNLFSDETVQQKNDLNESTPPTTTESTNGPCNNLHEMIEDGLREIFNVKTLDMKDLCSIAETCTLFQQITQSIIQKTIHVRAEKRFGEYSIAADRKERITRTDIERIFENFGASLSHVTIQNDFYPLELVLRRCVGDKLESLTLNGFVKCIIQSKISRKQMMALKKDLNFLSERKTPVDALQGLVALSVNFVEGSGAILENTFSKLERFEYATFECFTHNSSLFTDTLSFISRHNALKTLKLQFDSDDCCIFYILDAIGNICKNLEELSLQIKQMSDTFYQPLTNLKSLRILRLFYVEFKDFKLLSNMTELRELFLYSSRLPTNTDQFACLAHLTKLELYRCGALDVVGIIGRLVNLKEMAILDMKNVFFLNETTYSKIASVVAGRSHVLTLNCFYGFPLTNYHKKQKVRLLPSCYEDLSSEVF